MAKKIKSINCPKCGSGQKQLLKKEHYKCNNCGTTYFLDKEDVNIIINQTLNKNTPLYKNKVLIVAALAISFFSLILLTKVISNSPNLTETLPKAKNYRERSSFLTAYTAADDKTPIIILNINRDVNNREGQSREELYIRLYDPIKGEIVSDFLASDGESNPRAKSKRFSNGELFIVVNESKKILKINEQLNMIEDVTTTILGAIPELSSGIAKLEFLYQSNNGFKIVSNIGNEYAYFPLVDKLYTEEEMNQIRDLDGTFSADITESVHYIFTEKSRDFPEKGIQLMKYWYSGNTGYLEVPVYTPKWEKRWDNKVQLFRAAQIKRFIDLTPDRLYFKPEVKGYDNESVYIAALPNADESSSKYLQRLDTNGKVIWTFTPNYKSYEFSTDFAIISNGVVCVYYSWGAPQRLNLLNVLDQNGKVVKELNLDTLF